MNGETDVFYDPETNTYYTINDQQQKTTVNVQELPEEIKEKVTSTELSGGGGGGATADSTPSTPSTPTASEIADAAAATNSTVAEIMDALASGQTLQEIIDALTDPTAIELGPERHYGPERYYGP